MQNILSKRFLLLNAKWNASNLHIFNNYSSKNDTSSKKVEQKKPIESDSFAMNMFRGKVVPAQMFPFPDVLKSEQHETLQSMIDPVLRFAEEVNDPHKNDALERVDDASWEALKELGAFGLQVPVDYGGIGLCNTQYARMTEIVGANDLGVGIAIGAHQSIGFKGILLYGTEKQKQKYLPSLAVGKLIACYCLTEPDSGSDASSIKTRAVLSSDGSHYILNGSKIWISNGGIADIFTVFAKTEVTDAVTGTTKDKITAFIVERGFGGVTSGAPEKKMGIKASNTAAVFFEDVKVPVENVLGGVGDGFKVAMMILNNGRFGMASALTGCMRAAISKATQHAVQRKQFGSTIQSYGAIQEKLAQMSIRHYVTESLAYIVSGNMDRGAQEFQLEAAISKVYASEAAWFCIDEAIQILGGMGYMKETGLERVLRDLRIFRIFEGSNDVLRLFIALTGMKHAGEHFKASIENPLSNPGVVATLGANWVLHQLGQKAILSDAKGLEEYVHSTLKSSASKVSTCIGELGASTQDLLMRHRSAIVDRQFELNRMAEATILCYNMSAVLSRASRALVRGDVSAAHESNMAQVYCDQATEQVLAKLGELRSSEHTNNFEVLKKISNAVCQQGGVVQVHPLGY